LLQDKLVQPFLKWAGGKRQLLNEIKKYTPTEFNTFYEPFIGGGAVCFNLQPNRAVINDVNGELVNTYEVIRDHIHELISDLSKHKNDKQYFYSLRALDRSPNFRDLSSVARASRLIYLNKTCYNGLFRVNKQGQFNVPFGDYKKPNIVNEMTLRAVHNYLLSANVQVLNVDFADAVANALKGDFIYLDPPYDPVSDTSSFTGYNLDGFGPKEQVRLKETVDELTKRNCKVMLSNSATNFIKDLYHDYNIITVEANRAINSNTTRRGKVAELLVLNYSD
jgi:DNA adenine methylase